LCIHYINTVLCFLATHTNTHLHNGKPNKAATRDKKQHELTDEKVQTPQQRRANEAFAKKQETKRGKNEPVVKKNVALLPLAQDSVWMDANILIVVALLFVVCGGLIFELLRIIVGYF
jgi:hypothetical protein